MRYLLVSALLTLGCPSSDNGGSGANSADAGPGDVGDGGGECDNSSPCSVTFSYPAADGIDSVELRGDFAPDGWETGAALENTGSAYELELFLEDGQEIRYKFVLNGSDWVTDPNNSRTEDDGFGNLNSALTVRCGDCDPVPTGYDWRDGIMYFVFVDRFYDGDPANNDAVPDVATAANYQGGDLAGVLQKIEEGYFDDLGVNVLWLTAPVDNGDGRWFGDFDQFYSAYHGYWPGDLEAVESRIGTLDDLKAVVDAAHARDIKIVLDYVMNHVHETSPVYQDHPEWFWPLFQDGKECVCGGGCGWNPPEGLRCWFEPYLPDFNFQRQDARDWSVNNAIGWITDTGIDGYRLDAVKHLETQWIIDLRNRLKNEIEPASGSTFYLVGETFDGDSGLIGSYVEPNTMLDGQFDFPLRAQLARVLLRRDGSMFDLDGFLGGNDGFYAPGSVMGTFIGNHDLPRAVHIAEDFPQFGEWDGGRDRGWSNQPQLPGSPNPFERLSTAYTFLMTTRGIPLIYYGDEFGMPGGGDPDNRRFMQWDGYTTDQQWLRDHIAALTKIRSAHPALRRGFRTTLGVEQDAITYEMAGEGDRVIVAINRADFEAGAPGVPAGSYTDLLTGETVTAPLTLSPRSSAVLLPQ